MGGRDGRNRLMGFLSRLRRDARGNMLALTAAALLPLIGFVGTGIDMSRLYLVKTRLQHACDAGALAGRKQMAGGAWNTASNTTAVNFFNDNFRANSYGTTSTAPVYSDAGGGDVHGTASASVPMTLMALFGAPSRTLTVACDSQMQLPNTDVMFVLDTTGSMNNCPDDSTCNGGTGSKIAGLRNAVKCFYEVLAQLDTNGTCSNSITGAGLNSGSQLRFGFVPYSSNVNIGSLGLPANYFAKTWNYQSRSQTMMWTTPTRDTSHSCSNVPSNTSTTRYTTSGSGNNCKVYSSNYVQAWYYAQTAMNLSSWNGTTGSSITLPIGDNFTNQTMTWGGCAEELTATSDINKTPSASDASSQYAPLLPDAIYLRAAPTNANLNQLNSQTYAALTRNTSTTTDNYWNSMSSFRYFCPSAAQKLQDTNYWTPSVFDSYVDGITVGGNTYHDIGMLWGGRLISPDGMFGATNQTSATGGQLQRHVIFMTDGAASASSCDYTTYGVAWYDQRTNSSTISGCVNNTDSGLTNDVNTRLAALCSSVKNEPNTILWVISFGAGSNFDADTKTRLQTCATDINHYFDATDNTALNTAFSQIAAQITKLRLTK